MQITKQKFQEEMNHAFCIEELSENGVKSIALKVEMSGRSSNI